jgi:hypothetical protein
MSEIWGKTFVTIFTAGQGVTRDGRTMWLRPASGTLYAASPKLAERMLDL